MKSIRCLSPLIALVVLTSCGKEPTETQKAQLEPLLIGCSISVNPTSLDDDNPFAALARLGNLSEFTNKGWSLSDDETLITADFRADTTAFECDFVKDQEGEWDIEKVRRNGEEVYDRVIAEAKRAELKAQREANEEAERLEREKKREAERLEREKKREAERLEREKQKEEERLAKVSQWREKGYSNATYKYYAKYPLTWNQGMWNSPELRIVCDTDYPRFQLHKGGSWMPRGSVEFQFKDSKGNTTKIAIALDANGGAGEAYKSVLGDDARPTKESNAKVIKILKASSSVDVDGMTFTVDDISQVPCI